MKKVISLLIAIIFICSSITLSANPPITPLENEIITNDNFQNAIDKSVDDRIYTQDGYLVVPGGPSTIYNTRQKFEGDYSIEMRAASQFQSTGLMINAGQGQPPLWSLAIFDTYGLWIHGPNNWANPTKVASSHIKQGEFVKFNLDIAGNMTTAYLNDELINQTAMSANDTNGSLALRLDINESTKIDYIRVTQNGEIIWEDNFDFLDNTKWNFPQALDSLMEPIWEGDTVFEEPIWPIANEDGIVDDFPLIYNAQKVLMVQNMQHTTIYEEGTDYVLVDGKIRIPSGSSIPVMSFEDYYPTNGPFQSKNGRYLYFPGENPHVINWQILVTYEHSDNWGFENKPTIKSSLLPNTTKILENRQKLNIVYYGDSITHGWNSSGHMNTAPYMPIWSKLVTKSIKQAYPNPKITEFNTAVSGTTTDWGINNIESSVNAYAPDLVVLAFGMNDAGGDLSADGMVNNLRTMMNSVKAKNPNCEFVIVTTSLQNPDYIGTIGRHETYAPAILRDLEAEGVAVADITQIHGDLITSKKYADMTGNNINHPNDFLIRVYAQTVFETIVGHGVGDDTIYSDIPYVTDGTNSYQTLDIKLPATGDGPFPTVMFLHGGAWVIGDKSATTDFPSGQAAALEAGYAIVNVNYRLAQHAQWPAQIYDCKAAVRYLRANAEKYHLNTDQIAVWGASAGAHLAQFMGVSNEMDEFEDLSMGNAEFSSDINAVVSYYGISDVSRWDASGLWNIIGTGIDPITTLLGNGYTTEDALAVSPITYVDENTVPMLLSHSKDDGLVFFDQSTTMEAKLKSVLDSELVETCYSDYGNHGEGFWHTAEPTKIAINFLQKRFEPTKHLDSIENVRPDSWHVNIGGYKNKYLDIKYANNSATQKLNIVLPDNPSSDSLPLIVFIHGGGFAGGNSNGTEILYTAAGPLNALEAGYAVAMVDYRHYPEAVFPQPVHDIKAAIRYLRANADKYGFDPHKFAIWGESAGGHLVNFVALTNDNPDYEDFTMGNAEYSSAVQAVVSHYAITDMRTNRNSEYRVALLGENAGNAELLWEASPLSQVTSNAPPTYFQHGMADTAVEYSDSITLYNNIVEATGDTRNKLELFPGLTHAVRKFVEKPNATKLAAWLDIVLTGAPEMTESPTVSNIEQTSATISWSDATNESLLKEYSVYVNGDYVGSTTELQYELTELNAGLEYDVSISALSIFGKKSVPVTVSFATDQSEQGFIIKDLEIKSVDEYSIDADVTFINNQSESQTVHAIIASYDELDRLVGSKLEPIVIQPNETKTVGLVYESLICGTFAKIMFCDADYAPLNDATIISMTLN